MISSTPSPSASELAAFQDMLGSAPGLTRDWNEKCKQTATLLRRLSDTERERDEARSELAEIAQVASRNIAHESTLQAVQDLHAEMLRRHNDASDRWLEIKRLEAERDRLREMLAQADAALSVWNAAPGCEDVAEADCDAWTEEACERHRKKGH